MPRAAAPAPPDLADQLRELIQRSQLSNYALGRRAGVAEEVIRRFVRGERDLRLETAGRIAAALGVAPLTAARRRAPAIIRTRPSVEDTQLP